jgi:hypothetical protein
VICAKSRIRSRHAGTRIVDNNATNRDILKTPIARLGYEEFWPLELCQLACTNKFTSLSVLPALKTVHTQRQYGCAGVLL